MNERTKWSIIAAGEGANRISFQYYSHFRNPAIEDRALFLNTTPADVKLDKTFEFIISKDASLQQVYEEIKRDKMCIFGKSPSGAGNNWKLGEKEAVEDFGSIMKYINSLKLAERDVILGITTLGGGTGNGSLPYIIHRLKYGEDLAYRRKISYLGLGIIPYDFEAPQRYFNTICGLTRLLKYGEDGRQNVDMLLLVDNSQVERMLKAGASAREEMYYQINQEIVKAVNMIIAPSSLGAKSTIDVADYYQLPSNIGAYHFTPCMSLGNDPEIFEIETALEMAASNPMAPLDLKTAIMAYIVVLVPQKYVDSGKFSQEDLEAKAHEWAVKNIAGKWGGVLRYASLVSSKEQKTLDVMILLGGFSLDKILAKSLQKYYDFIDILVADKGDAELKDESGLRIGAKDIETIETRLREYIALTQAKIEKVQEAKTDLVEKLEEWGFGKGRK